MRTITLRVSGKTIWVPPTQGIEIRDSVPEPLIEISPEDVARPETPISIEAKDWLGSGFPECPPSLQSSSSVRLSAGEFLDAMLESDPDEVLLAVSAWLGIHAGRIRG